MKIDIDVKALKAFLEACDDAEAVGADEYVLDLYDVSRPASLDLALTGDGCDALAARALQYDAEQDGWYLGEEIAEPEMIAALLREGMAQAQ